LVTTSSRTITTSGRDGKAANGEGTTNGSGTEETFLDKCKYFCFDKKSLEKIESD